MGVSEAVWCDETADGGPHAGCWPAGTNYTRRDALERWKQARADGLNARSAAAAVGAPLSTLYRWRKRAERGRLEPLSHRPHRVRRAQWAPVPVAAVREARNDYPMWGKAKIAVLIRRRGFMAAPGSKPTSNANAKAEASTSSNSRPDPPNSTDMSSATTAHGDTSSTQHGTSPTTTSTESTAGSTPSPTSSTTSDPTGPSTTAPPLNTFNPRQQTGPTPNTPRLYVLNQSTGLRHRSAQGSVGHRLESQRCLDTMIAAHAQNARKLAHAPRLSRDRERIG